MATEKKDLDVKKPISMLVYGEPSIGKTGGFTPYNYEAKEEK